MKDNFKIFINYAGTCGSDFYRAFLPYFHIKDELYNEGISLTIGKVFEEKFDAYYMPRLIEPTFWPYYLQLKNRRKVIAWELDDSFWDIPEWSSAKFNEKQIVGLNHCLETADIISVSTEPLKQKILEFNSNVHVTPNLIDINDYLHPKTNTLNTNVYRPDEDECFRILWAGSPTHKEDLLSIFPVIKHFDRTNKDIKFLFLGYIPEEIYNLGNTIFLGGGCETRSYPYLLKTISPHIGIAPVVDIEFNKHKSNIKYLEMTACGAIPICSGAYPYKNAKGYVIPYGDMYCQDWINVITDIYEYQNGISDDEMLNESFRSEMALKIDAAQNDVIDNYSWTSKNRSKWINFFKRVAGRSVKDDIKDDKPSNGDNVSSFTSLRADNFSYPDPFKEITDEELESSERF